MEANEHLKFLFITGVSKFSRVSLFSDLNNLTDLTTSSIAHDLTGITQQELLDNFQDYIEEGVKRYDFSKEEFLHHVKFWYNGYSFEGKTKLYNPFSLLSFFRALDFDNFWFKTGTPTFLVKLIRNRNIAPKELEEITVLSSFFEKFSLEDLEVPSLLFQTGYLTIKDSIRGPYGSEFYLGYPNFEVKSSFLHNLLEAFSFQPSNKVGIALINIKNGLKAGKVEKFIEQINILLSNISHFHAPKTKSNPTEKEKAKHFAAWEGYFHTIIYLVTSFIGLEVKSEVSKHKGRLDLVAETESYLYLMEFKLDEPAANAIQQIKDRDYFRSYVNTKKKLVLVGLGFSKEERLIENWESEEVN